MTARRVILWVGVFSGAAFLVLAALWGAWMLTERSRLEAVADQIRAAGLPMTPEEVIPPPVEAADNAAPLLAGAEARLAALKESGFADVILPHLEMWGDVDAWDRMAIRVGFWAYQYPLRPLMLIDQRAYLEGMMSLREKALTQSPGDLPVEDEDVSVSLPPLAFLTRLVLPALAHSLTRLGEYEVELQVAQVGLALEEWRAEHGDYPETLGELGLPSEMLTDPFSGGPLIYRCSPEGATVYSVGKNRTDNEGSRRRMVEERDLVWSVKRTVP